MTFHLAVLQSYYWTLYRKCRVAQKKIAVSINFIYHRQN